MYSCCPQDLRRACSRMRRKICERCGKYCKHQEEIKKHGERIHIFFGYILLDDVSS